MLSASAPISPTNCQRQRRHQHRHQHLRQAAARSAGPHLYPRCATRELLKLPHPLSLLSLLSPSLPPSVFPLFLPPVSYTHLTLPTICSV
eukprot:2812892-Rhodomonas_salina.1